MMYRLAPNRRLALLMCCLSLLHSASLAAADVWKYTDTEGRTHFVDTPEKVPEAFRDQVKSSAPLAPITKAKSARKKLYEQERYQAPSAAAKKVEVYVAEWCPYCKRLEEYFKKERIQYTRRDIDTDQAAARFVASRGGGIPVTKIGDEVIGGYKPQAISKILKK